MLASLCSAIRKHSAGTPNGTGRPNSEPRQPQYKMGVPYKEGGRLLRLVGDSKRYKQNAKLFRSEDLSLVGNNRELL